MKEIIAAVSREYVEAFFNNLDANKILLHDIEYLSPEYKQIILQKEKDNVHQLRDYIARLQKDGQLKNQNPTALTFIFIGMMHWLYFWFDPDGDLKIDDMVDIMAEVFVHGAGMNQKDSGCAAAERA
ncbi:MAG: hypothetical protein JXO49_04130 [Deltaproteobacteria bacterium]|nr:hypothetical protein [Candidatus Anaeroferrophillus wilburensis]MBN2888518.1 hypothetical protein [Deltaproteobacteria bacterium]